MALQLVVRLAAAAVAVMALGLAQASEVRWKKEMFVYVAKGKNLKELLREFAASQGMLVVVAKEVEGTVNGKFNLMPASLLELLSVSFGFVWHVEGNVLHIVPATDVRSEVARVREGDIDRLRLEVERLGISDPRFPISFDSRLSTVTVSGPNRYVDLVMQAVRSLEPGPSPDPDPALSARVRVFPLRYAWAADSTYKVGSKEERLPGVATVMQQLYERGSAERVFPASNGSRRVMPTDALRALGMARPGSSAIGKASPQAEQEAAPTAATAPFGAAQEMTSVREQGLPQFRADGRMNAVIIRDLPERMPIHEETLRALDVKPGLVEIEVRIIEVSSDATESLGVDWRLRSSRVDIQVGNGNLPTLSWGSALADGAPAVGPNGSVSRVPPPAGVLTTVLGDAGRFLITRVNALAGEGRANLLSSPKILTLDNVEAVMESLSTFFVRVAGNLEVNLFDVSVGTSLRVTPLIVNDDGGSQQIKLAVRIDDGSLTGQTVDQVPIVRRSSITTQALINDGQALLIAGYTQESDNKEETGVPGLSSIRYLGRAFKYTNSGKSRYDRLFLLIPKVVALK